MKKHCKCGKKIFFTSERCRSCARKELWNDPDYRMKNKGSRGHKKSKKFKREHSKRMMGNKYASGMKFGPLSVDQKDEISQRMSGDGNPMKRPEVRNKISGPNSYLYVDGRSSGDNRCQTTRPKHIRWAKQIRERDNFICQECGKPGNCAHHIDYDPNNFDEDDGICLCNSCHPKTNVNRGYWEKHFKKKINEVKGKELD